MHCDLRPTVRVPRSSPNIRVPPEYPSVVRNAEVSRRACQYVSIQRKIYESSHQRRVSPLTSKVSSRLWDQSLRSILKATDWCSSRISFKCDVMLSDHTRDRISCGCADHSSNCAHNFVSGKVATCSSEREVQFNFIYGRLNIMTINAE